MQEQALNHLKLRWLRARVVLRYEATNGDGGRPSEIGIQVQISNYLKLLCGKKDTVVSVEEKAYKDTSGMNQEGER